MFCNGSCGAQQGLGLGACGIDVRFANAVLGAYEKYLASSTTGSVATFAEFVGIGGSKSTLGLGGGERGGLSGVEQLRGYVVGSRGVCEDASGDVASVVSDGDRSGVGVGTELGDNVDGVAGKGTVRGLCVDDVGSGTGENSGGVGCAVSQESRGPNWERNRAWKAEKKKKRDAKKVPAWRVNACPTSEAPSLTASAVTVDSRTAEEIEAARTLAVRRTFENRLAVVKTKHQLASYADKDKTEAIKRLEVARIEERINTTKAKSQASYKKCDTPLNSVGSAGSAGEFAWKQEIRKRDAVIKERDYYEQQLEVAMKFLPDAGKRAIAELPEPYIPTLEDIEFEDADISPYYSREEMEAEAAKWVGDEAW